MKIEIDQSGKVEYTSQPTIDIEYKDHEKSLREMLLEHIQKDSQDVLLSITFKRIGNKPPVHYLANNTFSRKIAPTMRLNAKEVIEIAKKKDRGSKS